MSSYVGVAMNVNVWTCTNICAGIHVHMYGHACYQIGPCSGQLKTTGDFLATTSAFMATTGTFMATPGAFVANTGALWQLGATHVASTGNY